MENYRDETVLAYDSHPKLFEEKFKKHLEDFVTSSEINLFTGLINGNKILDLGCGPGHHALYFKKRGFNVTCYDASTEMLNFCEEKGFKKIIRGNIEDLDLNETFNGIWAYSSLLHIPKDNLSDVAKRINSHLNPNGILGIALKEGIGEGFEAVKDHSEVKRWFSYYTKKEVLDLFKDLELFRYTNSSNGRYNFMNFLFRKS